ncbi:hypothetical protein ACWGR4_01620 [Embleya sp. NPDC055664]
MVRTTRTWKGFQAAIKRAMWRMTHEDDGYTTETVIVTALLAAAAIAIVAIIVAKITGKANGIDLGLEPVVQSGTTIVTSMLALL